MVCMHTEACSVLVMYVAEVTEAIPHEHDVCRLNIK